jgi:SNF2 family DNA or RNA helicase
MPIITENSERISQTALPELGVNLFAYQLASVKAMEDLEQGTISVSTIEDQHGSSVTRIKTSIGFLSNRVGSGKTNIILELARRNVVKYSALQCVNNEKRYQLCNGKCEILVTDTTAVSDRDIDTTLVVVPHSILIQWKREIAKTNVKVFIIPKPEDVTREDIENVDIVLCSSTKYNQFMRLSQGIRWNRVVFDEADSVRQLLVNFNTRFCWFVSASYTHRQAINWNTPRSRLINLEISHFPDMREIDTIIVRCDPDFIDSNLTFANVEYREILCGLPEHLRRVHSFLTRDIQSMVNAGDIAGAINSLGGSSESGEDIIKLLTQKTINAICDKQSALQYQSSLLNLSPEHKEKSIKKLTDEMDSLTERLENIKLKVNTVDSEICCICMGSYMSPVMVNCCNNIFCFGCISKALQVKSECVICRKRISMSDTVHIKSPTDPEARTEVLQPVTLLKSKEDQFVDTILQKPYGKFLVFSRYDNTFKNLLELALINRMTSSEVKGGVDDIPRIVKKFNSGLVNILFLNSENCGAGINLEQATDIIIYHKVEPLVYTQLVGRALRVNRPLNLGLTIHQFVYENEQ